MSKNSFQSRFTKTIALLITIAIPVVLIGWLLEQNYALSGTRTLSYDFSKENTSISSLEPWQRLEPITKTGNDYSQKLKDETVYFNTQRDISFETVTVEVFYRAANVPLLNVGMRINDKDGYKKLPLSSELLNNLSWSSLKKDSSTIFQKEESYASFDAFTTNPPEDKKILSHNFNIQDSIGEGKIPKDNISPLRYFSTEKSADFILATYSKPQETELDNSEKTWMRASNTFLFGEAFIDEEMSARFSINAPGLKETGGELEISHINLIFKKEPLSLQKGLQRAQNFFNL